MCAYSLFPRINPSEGLSRQTDNIISLTATVHPSFIPFNCKVLLSYGLDIYPLLRNNKSLTYTPKKLNKILSKESEDEIKDFFNYYYSIRDRGKRILLLHKYFLNEVNTIFCYYFFNFYFNFNFNFNFIYLFFILFIFFIILF